jgi:release factor glutamine methyltransferase
MSNNLARLIKHATQQLAESSTTAKLDAEVLLCYVLHKERSYLIAWPEKEISPAQYDQFQLLVNRRRQGHPVAHLIQQKEFWSLNLCVSNDTLIPRPETELLVAQILTNYSASPSKSLLDLGTGSGAIAIAIASERPQWNITATDNSLNALHIAQKNAQRHAINNITFKSGHWFAAIGEQRFDIIVSNPPYIAAADPHLSRGDVRFEPSTALISGDDGLDDIRHLSQYAQQHLNTHGMLIIEHGYNQQNALQSIFQQAGFKNIRQSTDLAGQPRSTCGIIL